MAGVRGMTPQERDGAIAYVANCLALNPDCKAVSSAREYLQDGGINATDAEVDQIAFNALMETKQ